MPVFKAFHSSSSSEISQFLPFSHFGSEAAARHRAKTKMDSKAFLYEVDLEIKKPLVIPDLCNTIKSAQHHWIRLVDQLHYDTRPKVLTSNERDAVFAAGKGGDPDFEREANAFLANLIVAKCFDGIAYRNDIEDPGSTSWMLVDPVQLKILSICEIEKPTPKRIQRPR